MPERKIDTTQNKVYVRALDTYEYNRVSAVLFPLLDALLADNAIEKSALCGKKVVLKPNLVAKREAETGITTHPAFIRACASYFKKCGAQVTIADSPGGVYTVSALDGIYNTTGMRKAAHESGASLYTDVTYQRVYLPEYSKITFHIK